MPPSTAVTNCGTGLTAARIALPKLMGYCASAISVFPQEADIRLELPHVTQRANRSHTTRRGAKLALLLSCPLSQMS